MLKGLKLHSLQRKNIGQALLKKKKRKKEIYQLFIDVWLNSFLCLLPFLQAVPYLLLKKAREMFPSFPLFTMCLSYKQAHCSLIPQTTPSLTTEKKSWDGLSQALLSLMLSTDLCSNNVGTVWPRFIINTNRKCIYSLQFLIAADRQRGRAQMEMQSRSTSAFFTVGDRGWSRSLWCFHMVLQRRNCCTFW